MGMEKTSPEGSSDRISVKFRCQQENHKTRDWNLYVVVGRAEDDGEKIECDVSKSETENGGWLAESVNTRPSDDRENERSSVNPEEKHCERYCQKIDRSFKRLWELSRVKSHSSSVIRSEEKTKSSLVREIRFFLKNTSPNPNLTGPQEGSDE